MPREKTKPVKRDGHRLYTENVDLGHLVDLNNQIIEVDEPECCLADNIRIVEPKVHDVKFGIWYEVDSIDFMRTKKKTWKIKESLDGKLVIGELDLDSQEEEMVNILRSDEGLDCSNLSISIYEGNKLSIGNDSTQRYFTALFHRKILTQLSSCLDSNSLAFVLGDKQGFPTILIAAYCHSRKEAINYDISVPFSLISWVLKDKLPPCLTPRPGERY